MSRNLNEDIGAWPEIKERAWPVHKMSISEGMGKSGLLFEGKNGEALNYITEGTFQCDKNVTLLFQSILRKIKYS